MKKILTSHSNLALACAAQMNFRIHCVRDFELGIDLSHLELQLARG
jgi:hypothetical protein